jgi:hypothetical protein
MYVDSTQRRVEACSLIGIITATFIQEFSENRREVMRLLDVS